MEADISADISAVEIIEISSQETSGNNSSGRFSKKPLSLVVRL